MFSKMYIVTDPSLLQAALRSKDLTFEPFVELICERVLALSGTVMKIVRYQPENAKEDTYMKSIHKAMYESMSPGDSLMVMNQRVLAKIADFVNEIGPQWEEKKLFGWIRRSFTLASTASLYGRNDPVAADESLIEAIWYVC